MNAKLKRFDLKERGICVKCATNASRENRVTCNECAEKLTKYQCAWQKKAKSNRQSLGLCICGKEAVEGKKICSECAERARNRYYKKKALGICSYCSNETKGKATRCEDCARKLSEKNKQLRLEVYEAYGGPKCNCCNESVLEFLTIDHINNDGAKHRKEVGRTSVLKWLKDNNYPDGYQVLCFNCNMGKKLNGGICPHATRDE